MKMEIHFEALLKGNNMCILNIRGDDILKMHDNIFSSSIIYQLLWFYYFLIFSVESCQYFTVGNKHV